MRGKTVEGLGTTQNSTPTAQQLIDGVVTQTGATGAGTVTLPTGAQVSSKLLSNPNTTGVVVGDSFETLFANLGGSETLTITAPSDSSITIIGTAAIGTGKNASLLFVNTGVNTWNCYVVVSA